MPRALVALAVAACLLIGAAVVFSVAEPVQVLPRRSLAPGYALVDQSGAGYTSESGRGSVSVYTFAPAGCGDACGEQWATFEEIRRRTAGRFDELDAELRLVTVALEPDATAEDLAAAATASGADGEIWRWIGGDATMVRTMVGEGFATWFEVGDDGSIDVDPVYVIVDGNGIIRGEYRYRTIADDGDKISRHLGILADEIEFSRGAASLAYEAAHLFSCYP